MGPGFVLIFWGMVAAVFGVIWAAGLGIFILSWRKKWRVMKWLSGTVVFGLPAGGLLLGLVMGVGIVRSCIPSYVFKDTFNQTAGDNVRRIQSDVFWFADTGSVYLRFETDESTFKKLLPPHLKRVTPKEYDEKRAKGSPGPSWWREDFPASSQIHLNAPEWGKGRSFASETTVMVYAPEEGAAYYHFIGID